MSRGRTDQCCCLHAGPLATEDGDGVTTGTVTTHKVHSVIVKNRYIEINIMPVIMVLQHQVYPTAMDIYTNISLASSFMGLLHK